MVCCSSPQTYSYIEINPLQQCLAPRLSRSMATETQLLSSQDFTSYTPGILRRPPPPKPEATATIYSFPEFEPLRYAYYPENHLLLPPRRDLLQRAIIFEADNARQGTANTKWRDEVHGSNRKIRPQKGTGKARLGDKKSPMLKGGGVAFGPKPRDFSTKLPRKVYDLAWRTALSYRYQRGELIVVQKFEDSEVTGWRWMKKVMDWNGLGKPRGSLIVTRKHLGKFETALWTGKDQPFRVPGVAKAEEEVDVKDLLKFGRLIIEKRALDSILRSHSSDIVTSMPSATYES